MINHLAFGILKSSIFKSSFSPALYAASLIVGVVALLAFYESPVSPFPVPPLPDPPVGRFPPEHPLPPHPHQQQKQQYIQRNSVNQIKYKRRPIKK